MTLDTKKYPMLDDPDHPPTCKECGEEITRLTFAYGLPAERSVWFCHNPDCDAPDETDAELDNRLTSEAEAAFERQQSGSGAGFLSPDALQRSLKR